MYGLASDLKILSAMARRREVLRWLGGAALIPLFGCGGGEVCAPIPDETAGPYPGNGSNGPNALALSGIVRSDIRSSLGGASGMAQGVPLTVTLTVVNSKACVALADHAIYLWHCDGDARYSMYDLPEQSYLRGVQQTDASGQATFLTIFPGCYPGRVPHMHFEVYPSLAKAMSPANKVRTSQLALPSSASAEVYATPMYAVSAANLGKSSLTSDGVFSDGSDLQVAAVTGNVTEGYVATLTVAIAL